MKRVQCVLEFMCMDLECRVRANCPLVGSEGAVGWGGGVGGDQMGVNINVILLQVFAQLDKIILMCSACFGKLVDLLSLTCVWCVSDFEI